MYIHHLYLFWLTTACGGGSNPRKPIFSGFVIKGPLHNATVFFADYDGDGILGENEPFALTNSDGSYTLSAGANFDSFVVKTTENTIDTSSGSVLSDITLKAPKGSKVVSLF